MSAVATACLAVAVVLLSRPGGAADLEQSTRQGGSRRFRLGLAVLAVAFSGAQGMAFILTMALGIVGLARGLRMIRWAALAKHHESDARFAAADPPVLIGAGASLIMLCAVLPYTHYAFAHRSPILKRDAEALGVSKEIAAYELVRLEETGRNGKPHFEPATHVGRVWGPGWCIKFSDGPFCTQGYGIDFAIGADGESFALRIWPDRAFPSFPFNYLVPLPSFSTDGSGKVRACLVRTPSAPCPADAPVMDQVNDADLASARLRLQIVRHQY